jgi:hypothetical protein
MENLLEFENWNKKEIDWTQEGCLLVKGLPLENGKSHLFLFKIRTIRLLKRSKKDGEDGVPVYMATLYPEVYKVGYNIERKLIARKVMPTPEYLQRFVGLSEFNVGLNNNKTPYWRETVKEKSVKKVLDKALIWLQVEDWVQIPVFNP